MQLAVSDGTTALMPVRDFGWKLTLTSLLGEPDARSADTRSATANWGGR